MARVYSDVNATLGPTWYDYGKLHMSIRPFMRVDIPRNTNSTIQTTRGLTGVRQSDMRLYDEWEVENTQRYVIPRSMPREIALT